MRLRLLAALLALIWLIPAEAQPPTDTTKKLVSMMVQRCLTRGQQFFLDERSRRGADVTVWSRDVTGYRKDEFKISASKVEEFFVTLRRTIEETQPDQAERVRVCLEPLRRQLEAHVTAPPAPAPTPKAPRPAPREKSPSPAPPTIGAPPPTAPAPLFPWPPPRASSTDLVPREILEAHGPLPLFADVDRRLALALEKNGYFESSYYAVPAGFALVTKMEQIDSDGVSKSAVERWLVTPRPLDTFDLSAYIKALFTARSGYYRVIVFIVTPVPFAQSTERVTQAEATEWLTSGFNRLPTSIGSTVFSAETTCTALIYEFERRSETGEPLIRLPGMIPGRMHLLKSGLWQALQ